LCQAEFQAAEQKWKAQVAELESSQAELLRNIERSIRPADAAALGRERPAVDRSRSSPQPSLATLAWTAGAVTLGVVVWVRRQQKKWPFS
jgi:hypothetical protein